MKQATALLASAREAVTGLRVGQRGKRGPAALTDRREKSPRYLVRAHGGGAAGRLRLIRQLCTSLILHGALRTTLHRAKGTQRRIAAYIRWAKSDTPKSRQKAKENLLGSEDLAYSILFDELGQRFKNAPSGFTHIMKLGPRPSDAALMAIIQLRGSKTDYMYHYAAMVAGRQLAIHSQGLDNEASGHLAKEWRAKSLPVEGVIEASSSSSALADSDLPAKLVQALQTPIVAGNGRDLHPAYIHLPYLTQVRIVKALSGRSVTEASEFDQLMRYHYDRTLAQARAPMLFADQLEEINDEEERQKIEDQVRADEEFGPGLFEDMYPLVEGEEGFEEQETTKRTEVKERLDKGYLPLGTPREIDDIGRQVVPRGAWAYPPEDGVETYRWAQKARQLVKGQHSSSREREKPPQYSREADRIGWQKVWRDGQKKHASL